MLYIFDMGGVVTNSALIENKILSVLDMTESEFNEFAGVGTDQDLMRMCSDGKIDSAEFWKRFSQASGRKIVTDWWHWFFHPVLNKKTVAIIRSLREKGFRVVCGTNTIFSHYMNHIERGDYEYFDQTYSSCYMGVSKPDARFWKIILTAEDVLPQDAVFIDDRKDNCDAAASLGIRAIQFTTAEEVAEKLGLRNPASWIM